MNKRLLLALAAVIAVVAVALPTFAGPYALQVARNVIMYMALAMTWDMLLRSGLISFGIAGLFGLGSYAAVIGSMRLAMSPLVSILFAGAFAGVAALVIGFMILRLRAIYFSIVTLALAEIARIVIQNLPDFTGGPEGLVMEGVMLGGDAGGLYWAVLGGLAVAIGASWFFEKSKMHLALTAIRNNETSARSSGIDIFRTLLLTFVVTSVIQGLLGGIFVQSYGFATPDSVFDVNFTLLPLAIALLGGIHSTIGPIFGALLLGLSAEWLKLQIPYGHLVVYGIIIVLVILFMPSGLYGLVRKAMRSGEGRKA